MQHLGMKRSEPCLFKYVHSTEAFLPIQEADGWDRVSVFVVFAVIFLLI